MLRNRILPLALGAIALSSISFAGFRLADVEAQGQPPQLPMVLYGDAPAGAVEGQAITALVFNNGSSTNCGTANVIDEGGLKFVIHVAHESQTAGCGVPGRTVQLRFEPTSGQAGFVWDEVFVWRAGPEGPEQPLVRRAIAIYVAKDGVAQ